MTILIYILALIGLIDVLMFIAPKSIQEKVIKLMHRFYAWKLGDKE